MFALHLHKPNCLVPYGWLSASVAGSNWSKHHFRRPSMFKWALKKINLLRPMQATPQTFKNLANLPNPTYKPCPRLPNDKSKDFESKTNPTMNMQTLSLEPHAPAELFQLKESFVLQLWHCFGELKPLGATNGAVNQPKRTDRQSIFVTMSYGKSHATHTNCSNILTPSGWIAPLTGLGCFVKNMLPEIVCPSDILQGNNLLKVIVNWYRLQPLCWKTTDPFESREALDGRGDTNL